MDNDYKEVHFDEYCNKCEYEKQTENKEPCDRCLEECKNLYSHKPVYFKQKEKGKPNK